MRGGTGEARVSATNKEWDAFLDDVAVQVDKLVLKPGVLNVFREKVLPFAERWEKHL